MTIQELKAAGALYFPRIVDALREYPSRTLALSAREAEKTLRELHKKDPQAGLYVDFYYFSLPHEAREKVLARLTPRQREYVAHMQAGPEDLVFPADETLLTICAVLNESETLFSTFYLTGENPSTWWGNYGGEYIVISQREQKT